jgi:hypothetical protein
MKKSKVRIFLIATLAVCLVAGGNLSFAQTFLFDFGSTNVSGIGWNTVPNTVSTDSAGQLLDVISSDGAFTNVDLLMIARFNGENLNGTTASSIYPSAGTSDSMFGNTEIFNNLTNIFPEFKLSSLDPTKAYNFTFYASRTGVTDTRTTDYTVTGATSGVTTLNVVNNIDNVAKLNGIIPDAFGEIRIALSPNASNNNGNHFTYLGILEATAVAVPEPATASGLAFGLGTLALRRRGS